MRVASLASLCRKISSGGTPSRRHPEYYADDGHLWVKSQELIDRPVIDTREKISDLGLANSSAKYYEEDTVLIAMYGATVGKLAILKVPATVNQAICALCVDPEVAEHRYVYYSLMATRQDLIVQAAGAAQQNLNQGLIRNFEIPIFPLDKQRSITSVLGSLDDLIENNRRRIEILEEMVRLLYQEWFVHFRFPGHAEVHLVDTDLGPIPKDWSRTCLAEEVELQRFNIKPFEFADEEFEHYSIPAFDDRRLPTLEPGLEIRSGKYLLTGETVMVSKLNPQFPRVWRVDRSDRHRRAVASTEFLVLASPGKWTLPFVYGLLTSADFAAHLATTAGGTSTSHQRVKPADVMNMPVVSPPFEVMQRYSDEVQPILKLADSLTEQVEVLREARDLLLPRLISGRLDVSELDLGRVEV